MLLDAQALLGVLEGAVALDGRLAAVSGQGRATITTTTASTLWSALARAEATPREREAARGLVGELAIAPIDLATARIAAECASDAPALDMERRLVAAAGRNRVEVVVAGNPSAYAAIDGLDVVSA